MKELIEQRVDATIDNVTPLGDWVWIKREDDLYSGEITLLKSTVQPRTGNRTGVVVRTGPGDKRPDGSRHRMNVKVGDRVIYGRWENEINIGGEIYEAVHEQQAILVVIE